MEIIFCRVDRLCAGTKLSISFGMDAETTVIYSLLYLEFNAFSLAMLVAAQSLIHPTASHSFAPYWSC